MGKGVREILDGRKERTRDEEEREREMQAGGRKGSWTDSANNALVTQKKRSIIASPRGRYFSNRTPSVNWRAN